MNEETVSPRKSTRLRKCTYKAMEAQNVRRAAKESSSECEEDEFSGEEVHIQDTVSSNLAGKAIYSFDKKKKHERLIKAAETPKKTADQVIPKTPHHVRKKIGRGIKSTLQYDSSDQEDPFEDSGSEFEGSESSQSTSDDEEMDVEEDEDETQNSQKVKTSKKVTFTASKTARRAMKSQQYHIKTEDYFSNNTAKKSVTSNHTLDRLETPRLSQDQLQSLLGKMTISQKHREAVCAASDAVKTHFSKWSFMLRENFNVLLYGLGSKKNVLDDFRREALDDLPVVVVNGFFPSLTLKDILDAITHDLLDIRESSGNVFEVCDRIEAEMSSMPEQHLYLIVHNIDGDMLRNNKCQNVLARLAAVRNIHLIASMDHINAPLIWDHNKLSKFNFIWWDVTSFMPYTNETSFESSMMVQRTGNLALSSLRNVFLSLTSNSKGIYTIILKYQLENNTNQYYQGLLFKDLYWSCREAFLVSSDLALRAQLTEFIDHKMVKMRRSADGAEYLMIPIANNLLQQFLSEQSN